MKAAALLLSLAMGVVTPGIGSGVSAQPAERPEAAIRSALQKWTNAFNARDTTGICDLFAHDLRYDFRGTPERDYNAMCDGLHRTLGDSSRTLTYSFDIKEIIVSGDMAVVRLVWTSRLSQPGAGPVTETREPGLDVFRRQPDGRWRISRYMAYEAP